MSTRTSIVSVLAALAGLAATPLAARADIVVFKTGRTMSVRACTVNAGEATLQLRAGGEVRFAADLIERVDPDEVPYPDPAGTRDPGTGTAAALAAPGSRLPAPDLSAKPYADLIESIAEREGVDARLVHAVVEVESNYEARARSNKGAKGLMQLMPITARQYAVKNPYDPESNLAAGIRHLKDLMGRWDLSLALAAYNAGEATVKRYGGLPPFPETRNYVRAVLQKAGR